MLIAAVVLWVKRKSLRRRELPSPSAEGKSAILLGVTISAVELPTAFPYFAAIAAIVGSGLGPLRQLVALALYNIAFVLPLILMILLLEVRPARRPRHIIEAARDWLQTHWPTLVAVLALVAGVFVTLLGVTGLASGQHNTVGQPFATVPAFDLAVRSEPRPDDPRTSAVAFTRQFDNQGCWRE